MRNPIAGWADLSLAALLWDVPGEAASAFVDACLGGVLALPQADEWVRLLEVLEDVDWSVPAAAKRLHVHRQTVHKRLRRLQELTGLDARGGRDGMRLALALALWRQRHTTDGLVAKRVRVGSAHG
jgi:DNA-binding PucR family transcriptional regulator